MRKCALSVGSLLFVVAALAAGPAAGLTLNSTDRSNVPADGDADPANATYFAGFSSGQARHNFFVFDLSSIVSPNIVTAAQLELFNPIYRSTDSQETYRVFDVSSTIAALTSCCTLGASGQAVFNDLGSGTEYGNVLVASTDFNVDIVIPLNASAIANINAALGDEIAFGGTLDLNGSVSLGVEGIFGGSAGGGVSDGNARLVLTVVPEPSTALLLTLGLAGLALRRR